MIRIGERLIEGSLRGVASMFKVATDLTDYLEPKVVEIQGFTLDEEFRASGWKEIQLGPLSGSVFARGKRIEELVRIFGEDCDRGVVFRLRQNVHNLLEGKKG